MVKLTNSDIMNTASGAVSTSNAKDFTGTVLTGSAAATGFIGALKDTAAASQRRVGNSLPTRFNAMLTSRFSFF